MHTYPAMAMDASDLWLFSARQGCNLSFDPFPDFFIVDLEKSFSLAS
jgi:hypothetical protein